MLRFTLAALALALPGGEALAQHQSSTPGALAGRSPHTMYRAAPAAKYADACATVAAHGPAGRLASPAGHARPDAGCAPVRMATSEESRATGRD